MSGYGSASSGLHVSLVAEISHEYKSQLRFDCGYHHRHLHTLCGVIIVVCTYTLSCQFDDETKNCVQFNALVAHIIASLYQFCTRIKL